MKKKTLLITLIAVILATAVALALILWLGGDRVVDTDGDGRPDHLDTETDDNLDRDNEVKVEDFFD